MFGILIEDYKFNSFRSFLILFFYRIMHILYRRGNYIFLKVVIIIFHSIKVFFSIQTQISYKATIGRRIRLPHVGFGVVISAKAVIEDDVTIFHLVTIGINEKKCRKKDDHCVYIGSNCYISSGAKIISATIAKNSVIGPNAVVYRDLPEGTILLNSVEIK